MRVNGLQVSALKSMLAEVFGQWVPPAWLRKLSPVEILAVLDGRETRLRIELEQARANGLHRLGHIENLHRLVFPGDASSDSKHIYQFALVEQRLQRATNDQVKMLLDAINSGAKLISHNSDSPGHTLVRAHVDSMLRDEHGRFIAEPRKIVEKLMWYGPWEVRR